MPQTLPPRSAGTSPQAAPASDATARKSVPLPLRLPEELLHQVLEAMPLADMYRLRGTCRTLAQAIEHMPMASLQPPCGMGPKPPPRGTLAARLQKQRLAARALPLASAKITAVHLNPITASRVPNWQVPTHWATRLLVADSGAVLGMPLVGPKGVQELLPPGLLHVSATSATDNDIVLDAQALNSASTRHALFTWHVGGAFKIWHTSLGCAPKSYTLGDVQNHDRAAVLASRRHFRLSQDGNSASLLDPQRRRLQFWRLEDDRFTMVHDAVAKPMPAVFASQLAEPNRLVSRQCPHTGRILEIDGTWLTYRDPQNGAVARFGLGQSNAMHDIIFFSPDGMRAVVSTQYSGLSDHTAMAQKSGLQIFALGEGAPGVITVAPLGRQLPDAFTRFASWRKIDGTYVLETRRLSYAPGKPLLRHLPAPAEAEAQAANVSAAQQALRDDYAKACARASHIDLLGQDSQGNSYHILAHSWLSRCAIYRIGASTGDVHRRIVSHALAAQMDVLPKRLGPFQNKLAARWSDDGTQMMVHKVALDGATTVYHFDFAVDAAPRVSYISTVRALIASTWANIKNMAQSATTFVRQPAPNRSLAQHLLGIVGMGFLAVHQWRLILGLGEDIASWALATGSLVAVVVGGVVFKASVDAYQSWRTQGPTDVTELDLDGLLAAAQAAA